MAREEAIKELKEYEDGLDLEYATPFDKAILYAIKALEQEPTKEEQALIQKWRDNRGISIEDFEDAMNALQEPCTDAVSREAVCDYIAEFVNNEYSTQAECDMVDLMIKGIQHLQSVNPQPCDDAISREAVIEILTKYNLEMSKIAEDVNELPLVTQKPTECDDAISREDAIHDVIADLEAVIGCVKADLRRLPSITQVAMDEEGHR